MIAYVDTSVLMKRYFKESGSEATHRLLEESEYLETSALTEIELASAMERSKKEGRIHSPDYRRLILQVDRDLQSISLEVINAAILKEAKRLVRQRQLRPGDAIQLASALSLKLRLKNTIFLCSDQKLLQSAKLEGLKGLDPTELDSQSE